MLEEEIISSLEYINANLRGNLADKALQAGIGATQANIILLIANDITSISHIAEKMKITKATVSDSVKSLKIKKLVAVTENEKDTRSKILSLTPDGIKLAQQLGNYSHKMEAKINEMHMSEKAVLLEALQNLSNKLKASPFNLSI